MSIRSINPTNGEVLQSYEPLTLEETTKAVDAAHDGFTKWRQTGFPERKKLMLKLASSLREHQEEYAKLISLEMGKRLEEAMGEIEYCAHISEFYANGAEEFLADQPMDIEDADVYIQYAPKGPLLGVMPWNFPFYQVIRFATPNIMAGNTCLVKHSGNVPQCAKAIGDLFDACGFPQGVFTNLLIPSEFVPTIIENKKIVGASLTGSEGAGASVAGLAGKNLKPSVLELGGNDAFIVLDDADLKRTVKMAVKGRMVNNGQSCVASKRFIVVESLAKEFIAAFKKSVEAMKLGDPLDEKTQLGPLSSEEAAKRLEEQVKKTVDAGATVVTGGKRPDSDELKHGAFYLPTILTDVTPDMPSFDEELFGPVATIYVVKDEAEAIKLANHSSFGLGGSVFTKDLERGQKVAEQIDTGMVFINQPTQSQAELPFGGTKNSGYGRELSHLGIMEFINKKLIHLGKKE
ncbi:succinate-semialdehyde dehydrogenase [Oceaniferula spumae]|uniref:Succinate-semialdehyde dehydrogenase n=1 Tax=Oceaniferula spumae TaxID=2979115 RepID=A0AAT9FNP9_9BACT